MKKGIYAKYNSIVTNEYEILNVNHSESMQLTTKAGTGYTKIIPTYTYSIDTAGNVKWTEFSEEVLDVISFEGSRNAYGWRFNKSEQSYSQFSSIYCHGRDAGNNYHLWTLYYNKRFTGKKLERVEKGSYLADIIADYGSLPADGRHSDGYWYVFVKMASDLKVNVGGTWRDAPTGFANIDGIWRAQSEFKANVNGIWK